MAKPKEKTTKEPRKSAKRKSKPEPLLTVAIDGEGVGLESVSLRQLAALLEATASTFEAAAKESNLEAPVLNLVEVRHGSAAYDMRSLAPDAEATVRTVCDAVEERGEGHSAELRAALRRMHESGRFGAVKLTPRKGILKRKRALLLAAPVESVPEVYEVGAQVYGRVVGLFARGEHTIVKFKLADGATRDFVAVGDAESGAPRLFNKPARARVTYEVADGVSRAASVDAISPWADDELLDALRDVRDELAATGQPIDAAAWLAELDS